MRLWPWRRTSDSVLSLHIFTQPRVTHFVISFSKPKTESQKKHRAVSQGVRLAAHAEFSRNFLIAPINITTQVSANSVGAREVADGQQLARPLQLRPARGDRPPTPLKIFVDALVGLRHFRSLGKAERAGQDDDPRARVVLHLAAARIGSNRCGAQTRCEALSGGLRCRRECGVISSRR